MATCSLHHHRHTCTWSCPLVVGSSRTHVSAGPPSTLTGCHVGPSETLLFYIVPVKSDKPAALTAVWLLLFRSAQMEAYVCDKEGLSLFSLYPPLVSLSTLKICCQAHSFDHNSEESTSSLRVQVPLSAINACQPIKSAQNLLSIPLHHILSF